MNSKAYSARNVNQIQLDSFLKDRDGQDLWIGVDVGKVEVQVVLNWAANDFERPWKCLDPILGTVPIHRLPGMLIRSWAFSRPLSPPHFAANSRGVR